MARTAWIVPKAVIVLAVICALTTPPALAATPDKVAASLDRAMNWILANQKKGNWELTPAPVADSNGLLVNGGQYTGLTAICTYALLCGGKDTTDPHVAAAVDYLANTQARGTYALGLRCLVWANIGLTPKTRGVARRDMQTLLDNMRVTGASRGMFGYLQHRNPKDSDYDHSASQFATLGLWALSREGFEVPSDVWKVMDATWRDHQDISGAWAYVAFQAADVVDHGKLTLPMTTAGVASLFLTQERLHMAAICRGNVEDPNIDKGVAFLSDHFDWLTDTRHYRNLRPEENYTLFGVSRIGAAGGYKRLGDVDWYQRATDRLLETQKPDGSWSAAEEPAAETALGALCLAYGSAPMIINKLEYQTTTDRVSSPGHWNQRPQDMLNFVSWMGRGIERRLNWQIVQLPGHPGDLSDGPVLYISGDQVLSFSSPEKDALRDFVQQGGIILGNADCGNAGFTDSFQKLGEELFPPYRFRVLPDDHVIFTGEQYPAGKWKPRPSILSLSNGARELMVLPAMDLSKAFQLQNSTTSASLFQLTDDIALYAMGKNSLRAKGETYQVVENPQAAVEQQIKIARLQYDGNWDPEPGGWKRLAAILHNDNRTKLEVEPVQLGSGSLAGSGSMLAHLTGTGAFTLTPSQRKEITDFVQGGGTLLVDAAGGSQAFASSAETELRAIFAKDAEAALAKPLDPDAPIYTLAGSKIDSFVYRSFARNKVGNLRTPLVCGVQQGGRIVCYFSREDLSVGLMGSSVDGVVGYSPQTATEIVRNIVLGSAIGRK